MKSEIRFIDELFRIVNGALRLDVLKVRNYTLFLAEKLEKQGEVSAARRLRKLLDETDHTLQPTAITQNKTLPVDGESRFPLVEKVDISRFADPPLVMAPSKWEVLREFLSVAKSHAQIEAAGVGSTVNLLIHGPPGCGKSRLARHISEELGLPLYLVRLDGVISSYLGSTSKNIRGVFEFAAHTPGVLFLDEFDAIAKLRGDQQELGELKRVVNSFIQNLDGIGSQSVVLAATNHEELLDRAIWRRFNYRLQLAYPTLDERFALWRGSLGTLRFSEREIEMLSDLADGFSGSDIREVCLRMRRMRIMYRKSPKLHDALRILTNFATGEGSDRKFLASVENCGPRQLATALRTRDSKIYSYAAIAELLSVSKATVFRWDAGAE